MVTIDMSTARAQITKRQRRLRRAAQRRLRKQRKATVRELQRAELAREARQKAIETWNAEEQRLEQLRDTPKKSPKPEDDKASTSGEKPRAVNFAEHVWVTQIPVSSTHSLPKPTTSPIDASICGSDDSSDSDGDHKSLNQPSSPSISFAQLLNQALPDDDDDDDPDFEQDASVMITANHSVPSIQRPRRRITATRLDVPLEQIVPAKRARKSESTRPPKRPRIESQKSRTPSTTSHHNGNLRNQALNVETPLNGPSPQENQSKQRPSASGDPPSRRPKNKRKRLPNTDGNVLAEHKRGTGKPMHKARSEVKETAVEIAESVKDRKNKTRSVSNGERPQLVSRVDERQTDDLISSFHTTNDGRQRKSLKSSEERVGRVKNGIASPSNPNGRSTQNGRKITKHHDNERTPKHQRNAEVDPDDQELEAMFCELGRQKAAIRVRQLVHREKKGEDQKSEARHEALQEKRKLKQGPTRYTEDGLRIMSYEDIAADQPPGLQGECPFDCSCCF